MFNLNEKLGVKDDISNNLEKITFSETLLQYVVIIALLLDIIVNLLQCLNK